MKNGIVVSLALTLLATVPLAAEVTLPAILADHMVVQRGMPVHVWGSASAAEPVTVTFRGETGSTVADDLGRWGLYLKAGDAGGPFGMTIQGTNTVTLQDVLVGDVWMAAGQSNMQFELESAEGAAVEIPLARHPQIRFLRVAHKTSAYPLEDVSSSGWKVCSPETAPGFSAVAYFFVRDLHERLHVPLGVIDSSWGGTPVVSFTSLGAIGRDPALMPAIAHWAHLARDESTTRRTIEKETRDLDAATEQAKAEGRPAPSRPWHKAFEAWAPAAIYNAMIAPVTAFPIRGAIWYQGESDASPERSPVYARLFEAMIRDWRGAWGVGEFPFLFVQLANWTAGKENAWPELREAQTETLSLARTGMAVTIDVGDPIDIHPRDKKTVGTRLALAARAIAYGERVEHLGPLVRQVTPEGATLRVALDHADGLTFHGEGGARGFEIAGADGKYVKAQARVEGATLVISSPDVPTPRSVRYAWADNPEVSLYNGQGLPASPFRWGE
jgi:sialate O-acetylesterase